MTNIDIEHIRNILMIKGSIIFYLILVIFRTWTQKKALKKLEVILREGEKIMYNIEFINSLNIFFPILVGLIIGYFILPLYLYSKNQYINQFAGDNFFFLMSGAVLSLLVIGMLACKKNVLTNYRLLNQWSFDFMKFLGKEPSTSASIRNVDLDYASISSTKIISFFWMKLIYIYTKDGKSTYLGGIKNAEQIHSIIEQNLNNGDVKCK